MTAIKSISLALAAAICISCNSQTTTKTPAKTTTTTSSTKTGNTSNAPQTISSKTIAAKPATTKTLQKKGTTTTKTTATPKTAEKPTQTTKFSPTNVTGKTIVISQQQLTPVEQQNSKVQTGTGNTTPSNTQQPSGKINTGTGNDSPQQTNTNSGTGGKIIGGNTGNNNSIVNTITEGDASSAIKEALMKGVQVGVDKVSMTDGYFGNSLIKIPFPQQVKQVESALRSVGMGSLVDNAVLSMNRAAESAAKQAGPIFINGIKQMTITDAVNIVSNKQPDAATQFLQRTTTESLVSAFKPSIKTALDKTLATKYWGDITGYYNKLPFVNPINTDLPDYVTRKAIDGLFYMVAQEEAKIRKDPMGTANNIIEEVFGKVKF